MELPLWIQAKDDEGADVVVGIERLPLDFHIETYHDVTPFRLS